MTTKIFFVRHGEVDNPNKIIYGRFPGFGLSKKGKEQIAKTAQILAKNKISAIYSSPLLRTKQSARIISKALGLPTHYSDKLLEVKSPMEGKTRRYVLENTISYNVFASKESNSAGETIQGVALRMKKFIAEIRKKYVRTNVVAVTHGDPIMIVKAIIRGLPLVISSLRPTNTKDYMGHAEIYVAEFNSQ